MNLSEAVREDYEKWSAFLREQVTFSLKDTEKHTKDHCARVLLYALLIAEKMELSRSEREVLCAAAAFHDSRRQDDWLDVGHGRRAADYYRDFCQTGQLIYDERVSRIMAWHDQPSAEGEAAMGEMENGVLLYRVFKDADGLDRYRLGPHALDVDRLRTAEARSLTGLAQRLVREDIETI